MNEGKISPDAPIKPQQSKAAYYGIRGGICYCITCCFCTLLIIAIVVSSTVTAESHKIQWRPICEIDECRGVHSMEGCCSFYGIKVLDNNLQIIDLNSCQIIISFLAFLRV